MKWLILQILILGEIGCGSNVQIPVTITTPASSQPAVLASGLSTNASPSSIVPSPVPSPSPSPHNNVVSLSWNIVGGFPSHRPSDINPNYTNCAAWNDITIPCNDNINITDDNLTPLFTTYDACVISHVSDSFYQIDCTNFCQTITSSCITPLVQGGATTSTAYAKQCQLPPYTWNYQTPSTYTCQSWNFNNAINWSGYSGL